MYIRVAASSPAWFTRRALVRNSFCARVKGFLEGVASIIASAPARGAGWEGLVVWFSCAL